MVRLTRPAYVLLIVCSSQAECVSHRPRSQGGSRSPKQSTGLLLKEDLGIGPIDTEIFHFHESWTLWRTTAGGYVLEGERMFESPMGSPHEGRFIAKLTHAFELLEVEEFAPLRFIQQSGALRCSFLPQQLQCDARTQGGAQALDMQVAMDRPYGLLWPLSPFSLAGLAHHTSANAAKPSPVQVVQLEEISDALPVLAIRSDGLIRSLPRSPVAFTVTGKSWYPEAYELTAGPVRKIQIWTSPEGLLLAADRPVGRKAR